MPPCAWRGLSIRGRDRAIFRAGRSALATLTAFRFRRTASTTTPSLSSSRPKRYAPSPLPPLWIAVIYAQLCFLPQAPFFVGKLAIKTLPTVVCFMDGRSVDRLIGFEQLGMTDEFQTQTLEARLGQFGVIPYVQKAMNLNRKQKSVRRGVDADSGSDEDDIFG